MSGGEMPEVLLNIYDAQNSSLQQRVIWPQRSTTVKLRNSGLSFWPEQLERWICQ